MSEGYDQADAAVWQEIVQKPPASTAQVAFAVAKGAEI